MRDTTAQKCELFTENRNVIHKASFLEDGMLTAVAGALYAENDKKADPDFYKECKKVLRSKEGIFSVLRGHNETVIAARMAISGDPDGYLEKLEKANELINQGKFFESEYRALAAMAIVESDKVSEAEEVVEKTYELIKEMKKKHPFLTSDEDTSFVVLLAMTGRDNEDILSELEENFQTLKAKFTFHDNSVYSLAQVVTAFEGNASEKCEKVLALYDAFKELGVKYGKSYELASLGTLLDVDMSSSELAAEVIDVADFLKGKKGFGMLDMSKQTRLMFGTMIVSSCYSKNGNAGASVVGGTIASIIAEQIAMMITIMIIASSSSMANSSN